jgi:pyruvate dehydrogenase E1 component alpha subunit
VSLAIDTTAGLNRQQLIDLYRQMLTIRRFEEKALENYTLGKIGGFLHLYIGEEAVAVGAISALEPDDHIVTHYRDHGYPIARGTPLGPLMAELFGKATGVSKGKGGSMHLADVSRNFWGGYAIVAGHIPLGVGLAFAAKYRNEKRIASVFFGDGATDAGAFHESMNLASVWKLPVVFVCENNEFGMGVRLSAASATQTMSEKAANYNMPVRRVNGMDVLAMRQAMLEAAEHARSGEGPYFLEAMCYRFRGHSAVDSELYRTKEEVEARRKDDPLRTFPEWLLSDGLITHDELTQIEHEVDVAVEDAVRFADESPWPTPESLYQDIYVNPVESE